MIGVGLGDGNIEGGWEGGGGVGVCCAREGGGGGRGGLGLRWVDLLAVGLVAGAWFLFARDIILSWVGDRSGGSRTGEGGMDEVDRICGAEHLLLNIPPLDGTLVNKGHWSR